MYRHRDTHHDRRDDSEPHARTDHDQNGHRSPTGLYQISPAPVTLPCYFTCPLTGFGRGTTASFTVSVTDAEGNVESTIGSGHTVTFTFTNAGPGASGTPTGAQPVPATGPLGVAPVHIYVLLERLVDHGHVDARRER